jgi:hypothetical protein
LRASVSSDRRDLGSIDYGVVGPARARLPYYWLAACGVPDDEPLGAAVLVPRCNEARVERGVFFRRQDLLAEVEEVLFDTTSIYCERLPRPPPVPSLLSRRGTRTSATSRRRCGLAARPHTGEVAGRAPGAPAADVGRSGA